jgi:hypothetical protein
MSQRKAEGDKLNPITKSEFLPPLQKIILLYLAKTHPETKNATAKAIKGHYKSSWMAFNYLEEKGLIAKIDMKEYRGRLHPRFWLTTSGVFLALIEGINPKILLTRTVEIYPENKALQCIVEVTKILGTGMHKIAYSTILDKGKLEETDVSTMFATQLQRELSLEQIKDLISIMKRYPEQFGNFKVQTDQAIENLKKVELFLKENL